MRAAPSHFASLLPLEECLGGRRKLYFGSADTAPTGRKTVVLWRPPIIAEWYKPPEANGKTSSAVALRGGESGRATAVARGATASPATVARPRRGRKRAAGPVSPAAADPLDEAGMVASTATGKRPKSDASTSVTVAATTAGKAEDGAGGGCASVITSLRGLDGWRKGPTDNLYNKEYMKLMGAELPRRSSARPGSSEGGAIVAKTPPPVATLTSSADKDISEAGAEDGGNGSTRHRPVDSGNAPHLEPAGDEPASESERTPMAARLTKHATRGSPDTCFESVGVGASSVYMGGSQAEELNSNAVAVEASGMKGMMEVAALEGAEAGEGGAGGVTSTAATKEGSSARGEDLERQGKDEPGWEDGRRRSPICETANILSALVKQRVKTLAFCRTRKLTELTLRYGLQVLWRLPERVCGLGKDPCRGRRRNNNCFVRNNNCLVLKRCSANEHR